MDHCGFCMERKKHYFKLLSSSFHSEWRIDLHQFLLVFSNIPFLWLIQIPITFLSFPDPSDNSLNKPRTTRWKKRISNDPLHIKIWEMIHPLKFIFWLIRFMSTLIRNWTCLSETQKYVNLFLWSIL